MKRQLHQYNPPPPPPPSLFPVCNFPISQNIVDNIFTQQRQRRNRTKGTQENDTKEQVGKKKEEVDLIEFREECRKFAGNWVDKQKSQFTRFGLSTDWKDIYLTMNKDVEVTIVSELINFLESEQLYLGFKPVMWSVVEQTALAEAEIEYKEKTSKAIYVKFPVLGEDKSIVIWTTTPWTIPCNRAIAYSNRLSYKILEVRDNSDNTNLKVGEEILICEDLLEEFVQKTKIKEFYIKGDVCSEEIKKMECSHPLPSCNTLSTDSDQHHLPPSTWVVETLPS